MLSTTQKPKTLKSILLIIGYIATITMAVNSQNLMAQNGSSKNGTKQTNNSTSETATDDSSIVNNDLKNVDESSLSNSSIITRSINAGPVVFTVLLCLILLSITTWSVAASKWIYLRKIEGTTMKFIKSFWDSRSLNDLNSRLGDYPYSPVREVFRNGYAELVRGSQLKDQAYTSEMAVRAALENLSRALNKAKNAERRRMEKYLPVLAISASASPFIGLFGTVWGIMNSFEGIARIGSASLAAVAPGISEALIATAFGLAAAIPAVIGYNIAGNKIRNLITKVDGFGADYMNIVERYLVSDRTKEVQTSSQTPGI
ncbi:MAG: MotA/TolQ/ExbB proton channel family protein [Bdellovibrionota bacterium]